MRFKFKGGDRTVQFDVLTDKGRGKKEGKKRRLENCLWIFRVRTFLMFCFHSISFLYTAGPFGERDEEQVFIQRIIPETNKIFVRFCSTGKR